MPRIPFQRPKKVEWEILSDRYGRLVAEPFEKGYGLTVGHSLRRALLSIVPGSAVSWVKIDGVRSADARIPGGKEPTAEQHGEVPSGALPVDAAYSPITRASYNVEMSRLGKITDYEKLVFELWTN